jgi:hypothetical protein
VEVRVDVPAVLTRLAAGHARTVTPQQIRVSHIRWDGAPGWVAHLPCLEQQRLRRRHTMPPITDLALLDTLMGLPLGHPIPITDLTPPVLRRLRRLPGGAVVWTPADVTRRAATPVTPILALVRAAGWQAGLRAASRFAMYCPRVMLLPALPDGGQAALSEASFYGTGVTVHDGGAVTTLLPAEPFTDWQPTAAWWRFTEHVAAGTVSPARS